MIWSLAGWHKALYHGSTATSHRVSEGGTEREGKRKREEERGREMMIEENIGRERNE